MARGESGRIVIEVEPGMKRRLYAALALSGSTLKDWFIKSATEFITDREQLPLPGILRPLKSLPEPTLRTAEEPAPNKDPEVPTT
ncbi:MAG: hypothetical protein HY360_13240 [Verrucomicrobia bacterium]|nr:hypothetical protein [Verrucomicrobiota bacterium]